MAVARARSRIKAEMEVRVIRQGRVIDLGVISSPFRGRLRNWFWKKRKGRHIRQVIKEERAR